jgi:hypothetical protein
MAEKTSTGSAPSSPTPSITKEVVSVDGVEVPTLTPEQESKLWRKIDLRLMPILSLMYLFSFLDRGNIGEL